jgi:hypothetical protein
MEEPIMKFTAITCLALALLISPVPGAFAGQPYPQMPVNMAEMQKVQSEYQELKRQKQQERKAITDKIAAEELARAKHEQEATGSFADPYAVAEMRTRERLQALSAEWANEDRQLEVQMHEKMMQNPGMGDIYKMQQEMMKAYGQTNLPEK